MRIVGVGSVSELYAIDYPLPGEESQGQQREPELLQYQVKNMLIPGITTPELYVILKETNP